MAKQSGSIPIEGAIGDLVFYKTKWGNLVRRKGNLNRERVMNEAAFERSRAAGSEFGRAGSASGLVRNAIKAYCPFAGDGETHARLSKVMGEIIREDKIHPAGERQVMPEHIAPLKSFEWIRDHALARSFWAQVGGSMTPEGVLTISLPGFQPRRDLGWPVNATHAQISIVGMSLDFPNKIADTDGSQTAMLIKSPVSIDIKLECRIPVVEGRVMMVGIGVQFFAETNGKMEALKDGAAFGIVG
jgi:hypothetical protein